MQPTAARSPALNLVTPSPTAVTRPTISWPGTHGYMVPGHSPRAVWMSEWQTPQYRISMATSAAPGARRGMVKGAKREVAFWAA